ncbi:MAG: glycosyltransferase family 4 protein [Bdellovibrionaceae bacterium]|nr:glycosyltransferase family 4 protein [Bdellovibrionales bacterium]MCB9254442.1 glycosyltransferase family 4 protein [Pseudobdellovibrionaceae bacterium]
MTKRILGAPIKRVRPEFAYLPARAISRLYGSEPSGVPVAFVVPEGSQGWILEGICREIARYMPASSYVFHDSLRRLPDAQSYYVAHYALVPELLKLNPRAWNRRIYTWFTHPDKRLCQREMVYSLNCTEKVFCTNTVFAHQLKLSGVAEEKIEVVLGGADPARFRRHERGSGLIGLCTAYYDRKRPDLMLRLIQSMPQQPFLLLGKGWQEWPGFPHLLALPNFKYAEAQYEDYPSYYDQMDVFLSVSALEGGPIPMLEAMMSNVVPVVSRTGFAHDIIKQGRNGFIFDIEAPPEEIASFINQALQLKADIRSTVMRYSWEAFSAQIQRALHVLPERVGAPSAPLPQGI